MRILDSCFKNVFGIFIVYIILGSSSYQTVYAQVFGAQEIKWIRVGSLRNWISSGGAEIEYGRRGRACCQATDQNDGLRWPAEFAFQDHSVAKSIRIGTTNFDDPITGVTYPFKVINAGTRVANLDNELMPFEFKMIGKSEAPIVIVDGIVATDNFIEDIVDEVDETIKTDRLIVNKLHTTVGITVTRKIRAFSQQNHDNYHIYEYVFKNTGIIDTDETVVEKTLTGVVFHFQYRYGFGFEGFRNGWAAAGSVSWGRNTVNDVVGTDPNDPNFEFRAQFSWYGPHSQAPGIEDDWGAPNHVGGGIMASPAYTGVVTLHADKSASDKSDDPFQPTTTQFLGSDQDGQTGNQYDPSLMTQQYQWATAGHAPSTHAQQVGSGAADLWGTDPGGYSQGQGFGPYTLAPGDSIRIVLAEAVAGLDRRKNIEVTRDWSLDSTPFTLPNGSTTNNRNEYKKAWVQTAKDSLFQTFRRAKAAFENNYDIPQPPPPPENFEVISGGDRIILKWSDNAVSYPNFDGYQVFRGVNRPDTLYEKVFECNASNVVHEFQDESPVRGFDYYYYVQSKDDGSTNDASPGVPLASGKFYTMTNTAANLKRPSGKTLSEIRIVPNPYDIRSRTLQFGNSPNVGDRIAFYGLPPECVIKIYTERGDLVETIEHFDGTGDEFWHSITSSRQIVVSGVYIAYFEVTEDANDPETGALLFKKGESTYRKFIILR